MNCAVAVLSILLLLPGAIFAAPKAHAKTKAAAKKSPGDCHWSQNAHARELVKDRAPETGDEYDEIGTTTHPKSPAWWFDTVCTDWEPQVAELNVGDDADVLDVEQQKVTLIGWIVAVKFERNEDHDLHIELSGTRAWEPAGHLIAEIPGGEDFCDARRTLWSLVSGDANAHGDSFALSKPVKVIITGFVFFDSHHVGNTCESSGGRGIHGPKHEAPNVKTVWELHPLIAVTKAP